MSNALVVSVTDELVAELEALAKVSDEKSDDWVSYADLAGTLANQCDIDYIVEANPAAILALLAERAELKRDAERYRWLRDRIENKGDMVIAKCSEWSIESWSGDDPDAAIDAAMQS